MATPHKTGLSWHMNALPRATQKALTYLSEQNWLQASEWYLAGGTALALQLGHRNSVDLDFFLPQKTFDTTQLIGQFPEKVWKTDIVREGTVYGTISGAKISFIAYPFFFPGQENHRYGKVRVLDIKDIAVMKIIAVSHRGRKRDFVDLYLYATRVEGLSEVIKRLPAQYPNVAHDYYHILKSLTYFDDAEHDPMPELYFKVSWKEIKQYFQREIPVITRRLLKLP